MICVLRTLRERTREDTMLLNRDMALMLAGFLLSACGAPQLFPPPVMDGTDTHFDFVVWKNAPNAQVDKKVQLGGQAFEVIESEGETLIVVRQQPIVYVPAYGPRSRGRRTGEFVVSYTGRLPANAIAKGHKLIVIGTTQKTRVIALEDGKQTFPAIRAFCIHVWKTGMRDDISEFSSVGAGNESLEENTHCISGQ